jgi:succinylglutamic semialdehyde dehydrogenase
MQCINGNWIPGTGEEFVSTDPSTGEPAWTGRAATAEDVEQAIRAARQALPNWSGLPVSGRIEILHRFREQLEQHRDRLAEAISREVGKPRWEAAGEVGTMIAKVPVSIEAFHERRSERRIDVAGTQGVTRYKPHGVLAVFGPFNFPGHIANGHIVPALLAGNTVLFKPSELAPLVAEETVKLWEAAGLPPGVLNLVQGGRETGVALAEHPGHDGILFTGSLRTGIALRRTLLERPEAILALELGGNNPLVVHEAGNVDAAVYWTIQSAYATAGQRCTCCRRLIVTDGNETFLERLIEAVPKIRIGLPDDDPPPFHGPLITPEAARRVLEEQQRLEESGGTVLVRAATGSPETLVSPGLIDVTECPDREDEEVFGPLLQVIRVATLEEAIREANETRYGLVAGLFSDRREHFETFYSQVRAGLINWNRPTTGASGKLPFGGVGRSGNHRPAGYFTADFCNIPVASLESETLTLPEQPSPGVEPGA